ncbi:hypothetical protein Scep_000671 [Stephania cephalantha]|uniref:Uncharacterized protein n=1 Tax=Stephania cephalantha TaxID=152367 RepID=A0AAP0L997_9MAGN
MHRGKDMDMFQLERDFNVPVWARRTPVNIFVLLPRQPDVTATTASGAAQRKLASPAACERRVDGGDRAKRRREQRSAEAAGGRPPLDRGKIADPTRSTPPRTSRREAWSSGSVQAKAGRRRRERAPQDGVDLAGSGAKDDGEIGGDRTAMAATHDRRHMRVERAGLDGNDGAHESAPRRMVIMGWRMSGRFDAGWAVGGQNGKNAQSWRRRA